ncbi:type IV secretory system conjugative DNA transfer family protein [Bacteroides thetaiotaomicron]
MERTHRTNPIRPSVVKNETLFLQLMDDMLTAYQGKDGKRDEWFNGALGILRGVSIRFYNDYPQFCTIPHIVNFICSAGTVRITSFLEGKHQSRVLAGAFLDAKDSPKTQSSYLSSLTNSLSTLANEKKVCYVLSGNDFDFNLIDPECPKLVVVSNAYQIENLISPVISLMLSISSRRFTLANKVPFFYFLDEATTFRIADFEKLPSVLREYLCSFVFLTQSAAKIEKIYGKYDRSSIESNFGNQFFGRTKDIEALKSYPLVFGKEERQRVSKTTGSSRGGENRSRTVSTQKEEIYDTNFFTSLKSGEFVGSAAHSNMRNFHLRFEMYEDKEDPLPIVHPVLASDIEENYQQIIRDIQGIE